jgi:citrate lyase gamma subunit
MNIYTKNIAELLNISTDKALKIQDHIDEEIGLDYSECTTRQFNSAVKQAVKEMAVA